MTYPKIRIIEKKCIKEEIPQTSRFTIFYIEDGEEKVLRVYGTSEELVSEWFYKGLPNCKIKEIKKIVEEDAPNSPIYTYKLK